MKRAMRLGILIWATVCLLGAFASKAPFLSSVTCRASRHTAFLPPAVLTRGGSSPILLRLRLPDGSMQRIQVADQDIFDKMTLQEVLSAVPPDALKDASIQSGASVIADHSKTLSELGLKHGSLLTVTTTKKKAAKQQSPSFATKKVASFDPFPDLAKDYETATLRAKTRRSSSGGMSFSAMASLQAAMHTVEPQPEGKLKRVYMCATSAARFQSNCIVSSSKKDSKPHIENRVGLLLGTVQRERVNSKPKARTSLSSVLADDEYCQAVKVHAVWEPPLQKTKKGYDATALQKFHTEHANVLRVASYLGLQPVGWIFTYDGSKEKDRSGNDALPMFSNDIQTGALLQIENMQAAAVEKSEDNNGSRFVTLAMDASSGATEAFQLSDVAVQMVAEDMFVSPKGRHVKTKHPVIVDGKETQELDSVLCLVNTAMLSHEGVFSGKKASVKKKTGSLSSKTRKAILKAVDSDSKLLEALCDFNTLLALDDLLQGSSESEQLCAAVRKWARGQKRTTVVDNKLKKRLKVILDHV